MSAELPRVLVVTSNNFNLLTGGGITLTNLFRDWPSDRIANLHDDRIPTDSTVCRNFFRLGADEIQWAWPFSLVLAAAGAAVAGGVASNGKSAVAGRTRPFARMLVGEGVPRTASLSSRLVQWIDAFRPELVYGFLGSLAQIRLTRAVAERWSLPLAVHIMDDWPATTYRGSLIGPFVRPVVLHEFKALLERASVRIGICEAMARQYEARYGGEFLAFHNAIDADEWRPFVRREWGVGSPIRIRYVGSVLGEAQRTALRQVCEAASRLRRSGVPIEFWVHAPAAQVSDLAADASALEALRLAGPPEPAAVPRLLTEADALVLPFNFDARSARYIRLSMPTKVPAYMMSGTPVLVYGPPEAALVRYAADRGWGLVVDRPDLEMLAAGLKRLVSDVSLRTSLGRRAQEIAFDVHDAAAVRPRFQQALAMAAGRRRTVR